MANKYGSPEAFRRALEKNINDTASGLSGKEKQVAVARERKSVAFDALLARVKKSQYDLRLKGAYAMAIRLLGSVKSRPTKDMDFVGRRNNGMSLNHPAVFLSIALEEIGQIDLGDYFTFVMNGQPKELQGSGEGSWRFQMMAKIGPRIFEKFHIDVALGDSWFDEFDEFSVKPFSFAGMDDYSVDVITAPQHYAEKLHAFTLDRGGVVNSRVKDLVDMVIFIKFGIDPKEVLAAAKKVFADRATHEIPAELPEPPKHWPTKYDAMARDLEINISFEDAVRLVRAFHDEMLSHDFIHKLGE